ncbi:hypothetical protein [Ruminiclostridium cellobioparum]|uniref:hypothetical protein n=1 Tax=Ruminiclostridium cellobioparum TaxID=29355 RepID=UPI0004813A30|nr:hypothetical protein [Ruminiclostridium cellobioparum]
MQRERQVERLKNYIIDFPDLDIWIISEDNRCAELYWERINGYLCTNKKPLVISKGNYYKDGYNTHNAIILLCGQWYKNPIAFSDIVKMHLKTAKFTLPIDDFPEPIELQEKDMNHREVLEGQINILQDLQGKLSTQCAKGLLNVPECAARACEVAKIIESLSATAYNMRKFRK